MFVWFRVASADVVLHEDVDFTWNPDVSYHVKANFTYNELKIISSVPSVEYPYLSIT